MQIVGREGYDLDDEQISLFEMFPCWQNYTKLYKQEEMNEGKQPMRLLREIRSNPFVDRWSSFMN